MVQAGSSAGLAAAATYIPVSLKKAIPVAGEGQSETPKKKKKYMVALENAAIQGSASLLVNISGAPSVVNSNVVNVTDVSDGFLTTGAVLEGLTAFGVRYFSGKSKNKLYNVLLAIGVATAARQVVAPWIMSQTSDSGAIPAVPGDSSRTMTGGSPGF